MAPGVAASYVLVVEDDRVVRELYRSALQRAGFTVVAVDDGIRALQQVEATKPAAVLLDLALPLLSGRDVQAELKARANTHDIPIIVVTGGDTRDLDPADCACILSKPVSVDALIEAVDRCLRKYTPPGKVMRSP